ncbi:MAG: hypothetical protein AB1512_02910 [Thermodesulfobacteriota bacterium]
MSVSSLRVAKRDGLCSEDEARRLFQLEAEDRFTELNYDAQVEQQDLDEINQLIQAAGGVRPPPVQLANVTEGFMCLLVGLAVLYIHYCMARWALGWVQMREVAELVAVALPVMGAAGVDLFLHSIMRIFLQRKHDALTIVLAFLSVVMFTGSVYCTSMLGKMRADLIEREIREVREPLVIDGEKVDGGDISEGMSRFFGRNLPILGIIFPLMAVVFDLGSGVLLHIGRNKLVTSVACVWLLCRRRRVTRDLVRTRKMQDTLGSYADRKLVEWKQERIADGERKQRDAERAARRTSAEYRSRKIAFALGVFLLALIASLILASRSRSEIVAGMDISLSEKKTLMNGQARLGAFGACVERIIPTLELEESLRVVCISGRSRADPWVIFSATTGKNPGYFGERLQRDHALITAAWRKRYASLKPSTMETDLIGFFDVAADFLRNAKRRRVFVFSDGMNCTNQLNLEKPFKNKEDYLRKLGSLKHFPNLEGASVRWFGAGGPNAEQDHFRGLELFWRGFVERSGGSLEEFTSLLEVRP